MFMYAMESWEVSRTFWVTSSALHFFVDRPDFDLYFLLPVLSVLPNKSF